MCLTKKDGRLRLYIFGVDLGDALWRQRGPRLVLIRRLEFFVRFRQLAGLILVFRGVSSNFLFEIINQLLGFGLSVAGGDIDCVFA